MLKGLILYYEINKKKNQYLYNGCIIEKMYQLYLDGSSPPNGSSKIGGRRRGGWRVGMRKGSL
jgi:hypothetical protein